MQRTLFYKKVYVHACFDPGTSLLAMIMIRKKKIRDVCMHKSVGDLVWQRPGES